MDQGKRTYYEMLAAIVFQTIVIAAAGAFISKEYVLFPVSVIIGAAVAMSILRNMMRSIDIALDLDSETAKKYGRRQSIIRIALMGLILCIAFYFKGYVEPWGVCLGIFTLKFSAYLQPVVHKCLKLKIMKRRIKDK